jgi:hypothetical protein
MFESHITDTLDTNEQKADSLPPLLLKVLRLDTVDKDTEEQKRKRKRKHEHEHNDKSGGKAKHKQADGSAEPSGAGGKAGKLHKSKSDSKQAGEERTQQEKSEGTTRTRPSHSRTRPWTTSVVHA